MQIDLQTASISISLLTLGSLIITIFKAFKYYGDVKSNYAKLELKVETMWDFLTKRGESEGLQNALLTRNSPLKVTEKAIEAFNRYELTDDLKLFYRSMADKQLSDGDFMLEVERKFGQKMVEGICRELEIKEGACLVAASIIAKEP